MQDWHLRQFEICPVVCEVRYISNRKVSDPFNESKHAPGFKRIGFIQSSTRVQAVESIHLVDAAGEKFQLWPFEITFYGLSHTMTGERTCVIGCESMPEQRHWIEYIEKLIEDKAHLSTERYVSWRERVISEAQSRAFKQFSAARNGSVDMESHVNAEAFRRARLINGKVFIDAEKAFHECAVSTELGQLALEVALMGDLMEELGLKVTGLQMDMFLEEIFRQRERRSGDDAELARELTELEVTSEANCVCVFVCVCVCVYVCMYVCVCVCISACMHHVQVVSEAEFEHIFKTVFDNHTSEPSEQIKGKLLLIMSRSKNPFIQMLSIEEQRMLIDGRGADGSPNCWFKTFEDGSVIVRQGDEGHSMFIVVDGQLSVVVQFGSGPTAQKKEVATLPAGSVMGEMSLVLDKPRSATCIVKSGTCDVAEITKGALEKLMEARPYLQRELQEIVHRRDTANVLTGVNAKKKSTTLLEQKHVYMLACLLASAYFLLSSFLPSFPFLPSFLPCFHAPIYVTHTTLLEQKQETTTRAPARGQRAQGARGGGRAGARQQRIRRRPCATGHADQHYCAISSPAAGDVTQ